MGVHVPQGPDASGGPVKGQSGEREGEGSRRLAVMPPLDQDLQPSHLQGALSPLVGKGGWCDPVPTSTGWACCPRGA